MEPLHHDLVFVGPLSSRRADHLIDTLHLAPGERVLDLGCGWGELLLRALAAEPGATGVGVDLDDGAVAHGRELAAARGLAERVTFTAGDAAEHAAGPVEVAVNLGASHVFGGEPAEHTARTLARCRELLAPGGRLLLGECFWRSPPSAAALEFFGGDTGQYGTLGALVELAHQHGYRLLAASEATLDEWDAFQFGFALGWERTVLTEPDHPDAAAIRERADRARTSYLDGWRGVLGMAYLTLGVPR